MNRSTAGGFFQVGERYLLRHTGSNRPETVVRNPQTRLLRNRMRGPQNLLVIYSTVPDRENFAHNLIIERNAARLNL